MASPAASESAPKPDPSARARTLCGGGYELRQSHPFTEDGVVEATTFLAYDKGRAMACAVTLRTTPAAQYADVPYMSAYIQPAGTSAVRSSGNYRSYAGPARAHDSEGCLRWGGRYRTQVWHAQTPTTPETQASCPATK
ncbi:hypothetical protein [Streptomyces sp. NPDC059009]|uniref:hypothetical protein n=1 Tax=Streptomyces sp. NPDC059009 TaxID=3346694 RepID=UPI0036982448